MTRRVFISYQHTDHLKAHGLNLMTYNHRVGIDFTGRHLLSPVSSTDPDYIGRKIREKIRGSSATIVVIGDDTAGSDWVAKEIEWSRASGKGVLGIRISRTADVPAGLDECGAEILDWFEPDDVQAFDGAIERAIVMTSKARNMPMNTSSTCSR